MEWLKKIFSKKLQRHTCPDRLQSFGPWQKKENEDTWNIEPNGDRTCSFCGSLHFDDFEKCVDLCLRDVSKCRIEKAMGKNYKIYVTRPEIKNAGEGGIKFYTWHCNEKNQEYLDEFNDKKYLPSCEKSRDYFNNVILPEFKEKLRKDND